jgi:adenine-specific DNA methylase
VTNDDLAREKVVEDLVSENLSQWQMAGFVPDMPIEPGFNTTQPIRERGWTHWQHLFSPRGLLNMAKIIENIGNEQEKNQPYLYIALARTLDFSSRLSYWESGLGKDLPGKVFSNQSLNTWYSFGVRSARFLLEKCFKLDLKWERFGEQKVDTVVTMAEASELYNTDALSSHLYVTDPPYADAVNYHEITEFFIAWLRKSPPAPFDQWTWDSRRNLAIKGSDGDFRRGMVDAYKAMADRMPDNGMQCVMFTHQDTGVWSDMVGIFWAAGLQVIGAWYIATETTSELKKGGYVQGTVILMLRKRPDGDRKGFTRRIYPAVHKEVESQIEEMLHLNQQVEDHTGEPVFNDADLQMAGYAAALKVLTSYTEIGGEDVTTFALRPRQKGEKTVVDDIVQQASETANSLLVPDGLKRDTWQSINGIQRFYLRMLDIETTGASKLDNYQNFAKAFRVEDYTRIMANTEANSSKLKQVEEMTSRDLMDTTELGATHLGHMMVAIQQLLNDVDIKVVVRQLAEDLPDYFEKRGDLIDMARFLAVKATHEDVRHWADVLGDRIANEQLA